jgi:hypothetical protein
MNLRRIERKALASLYLVPLPFLLPKSILMPHYCRNIMVLMKNHILVILHLQNIIIYINEVNKNNHDLFFLNDNRLSQQCIISFYQNPVIIHCLCFHIGLIFSSFSHNIFPKYAGCIELANKC